MAYRLAEAGRRVVVIEHGGSDAGPFIQMPGALSYPMNMASTTGVSSPSPSRIWAGAAWPPRAAR
jgi:choline dehydrogenase-like flavoprotein